MWGDAGAGRGTVHGESPPCTGRVSRHQGREETGPGKSCPSVVCKAVRSRHHTGNRSACLPPSLTHPQHAKHTQG